MNRYAAIDVGSNSALLLIAEGSRRGISRVLVNEREVPRLAAGLAKTGRISRSAIARLISAMKRFKVICEKQDVSEISCCGTSALRVADNAINVIEEVGRKTGIAIEVISGKREAGLTFLGAMTGLTNLKEGSALIDVGGGSTEIVYSQGKKIVAAFSYDIGAVNLTELLETDRKKSRKELHDLECVISDRVREMGLLRANRPVSVVLSGGTPIAIQAYYRGLGKKDIDKVHNTAISDINYLQAILDLGMMSLSARREALKCDPERADVIVAGGLLSFNLAEQFGPRFVRITARSLRYGQLYELLGKRIEFA